MKLYSSTDSLVNMSNSLLAYYGIEPFHSTLKPLDKILSTHKYKKIAVILYDGLNKYIKEKHLSSKDFIRRHDSIEITSVFPPTTVAATTSFLAAKYPNQTGYLGWSQYFKNIDTIADVFSSRDSYTGKVIPGPHLAETLYPHETIVDLIAKTGINSQYVYPFPIDQKGAKDFNEWQMNFDSKLNTDKETFIYAYFTQPDSLIHQYGVDASIVKKTIKSINSATMKLCKKHPDTLFLIIADHGLIDTEFMELTLHPDLIECLTHKTYLDARSTFFKVKPECSKKFVELFKQYYGNYFILKSKKEVIDEQIFGLGDNHPLFEDILGDYLAISISNKALNYSYDGSGIDMIGAHAGSSESETQITISVVNK